MGTAKRERQKANRQLRLEEMAKDAKSRKFKRNALIIGLGLPLVVLAIFAIAWLSGDDDGDASSSTSIPPVTGQPVTTDSSGSVVGTAPTESTAALPSTVPPSSIVGETPCPAADGSSARVTTFQAPPPTCVDPAKTYTANVSTNFGDFAFTLNQTLAPNTVNNFVVLARYHYFDNTTCHRIITDFMIQCGDPTGSGSGNPGYQFDNENPDTIEAYIKGSVSMANAGQGTNGSQFFIATSDTTAQALGTTDYSLFGQVTDGLDTTISALNALGGDPASNGIPPSQQVVINSITITES